MSHHKVTAVGDSTEVLSAQVEAHKNFLESEFQVRTKVWTSAENDYQAVNDQVRKTQNKLDTANRKMGGSSFNTDGTLGFLCGYENQSHLRPAADIIRELHRMLVSDMMQLRQNRVELLLQELNDTYDYDMLSQPATSNSHLVTNISASRAALRLLTRRGGIPLSKGDIIRQVVSSKIAALETVLN